MILAITEKEIITITEEFFIHSWKNDAFLEYFGHLELHHYVEIKEVIFDDKYINDEEEE